MHISEILLGPEYIKTKRKLAANEYASEQQHEKEQRINLAVLLNYAIERIPYYRRNCRHLSGRISEDNAIELLQEMPLVTKEIIRDDPEDFAVGSRIRKKKGKTGGSTGNTLTFYYDRFITRQREKAFMWDQWSRIGYKPGERIANFRGNTPKSGRLFDHDFVFNTYVFSSFDIVDDKISEILQALKKIRPKYLHGYPSTLCQLSRLIKKSGSSLDFPLKAVLCGSERINNSLRELIRGVFQCRVYSWYGHSEYAVLGGECEYSSVYHLYPQYGFTEFMPTTFSQHSPGKVYEIIATGFNNGVMPFIRYRTSDYALLHKGPCLCGRNYRLVKEIIGRGQEFLLDSKKNLISVTALTSIFEKEKFIAEFVFRQKEPGKAELIVVPDGEAHPRAIESIKTEIAKHTEGRLEIEIVLGDAVLRTSLGKLRYVDQQIDLTAYLDAGVLNNCNS
jgi:phenylacetate-CoA ligase